MESQVFLNPISSDLLLEQSKLFNQTTPFTKPIVQLKNHV